ncbi:hypothetical protein [Mesorhizobium sp.]|uniref:hypothetical protein n=1 Tax=Mesorhizobium sp. TaxID=1871066 RepID=UPI003561A22D
MEQTDLLELLDDIHAQLSKIRQAVADSDHAGAMFTIDCLVGAAAEQTRCKLASLEHAGMPVGRTPAEPGPPAEQVAKAAARARR